MHVGGVFGVQLDAGGVHVPLLHVCVSVFVHPPVPHVTVFIWPAVHSVPAHEPALHVWPAGHAWPHEPQLLGSVWKLTHVAVLPVPHCEYPLSQAQDEPLLTACALHA